MKWFGVDGMDWAGSGLFGMGWDGVELDGMRGGAMR